MTAAGAGATSAVGRATGSATTGTEKSGGGAAGAAGIARMGREILVRGLETAFGTGRACGTGSGSVSYTHLDVYKRQSHISTGQIHVPHALRRPLASTSGDGEPGGGYRFQA